ncbi:MAG TPA: hypothetical protein ENN80_03810 [Candidatus Hydrogenedentes bacterium]|nr:hypothetical protein [Candidatus Hydrogenedentota bacterium]
MKLMIPVAATSLVVFFIGLWFFNPPRGPELEVDPHEKGFVEEVNGTTVLHVKGSGYEMGYQQGALLKERAQAAINGFDKLLDLAEEETGVPRFVFGLVLDAVYRLCHPYIPERFQREMEGLADSSGTDLRTIRRAQVVSVVTERACSAFAVFGKATKDGKLYHGRNFDWVTGAGIEKTAITILYEPDGGIPFASSGYLGYIGALSGMNMEGISISQIGAITKDGRYSGIPLALLLRRILEEAHDLDEATDVIENARRTVGYNYVVADGDVPDARAYETTARHCVVFGPNDPKETVEYAIPLEDAVFRADEAMDPTVRSLQECANAPDLPYGSNSYDHRYKGMATRIQEHYGAIDQPAALDILKAVAMRGVNLHSVLYNSTDREMWVAHAKDDVDAWKTEYVHYDLKRLFTPPPERK